ncbi:DUF6928 family protein [Haloglycomyces albus]|uniref:DUF6928 family protein n=1 Tax=Haloglycomyces albus TaxID=526067 RepID=UPI00046D39DA|nr:hypothetical protein [Haloglycomyces albus]
MGSKIAMMLIGHSIPDRPFENLEDTDFEKSRDIASRILGDAVSPTGDIMLDFAVWPQPNIVCVASLPGYDIISTRSLAHDLPSETYRQFSNLIDGRDVVYVAMHSMEDWASFGIWRGKSVRRMVSMSPRLGILENFGRHFSFENTFWAGERSVPDYSLEFHPIDFGNEVLREFFGFVLEGRVDEQCIDLEEVLLPSFRAAEDTY